LPSDFADIVIFLENEIVAIELKIDPLEISHLLQLYGYLENLKKEIRKNIKSFLKYKNKIIFSCFTPQG